MMLKPAGVHHDYPFRFANPERCFFYALRWHAGHLGGLPWIPCLYRLRDSVKTCRIQIDEFAVFEPFSQDDMQDAHQQGEVGSRAYWQIEIGVASDGSQTRVGHDQPAAVVPALPDVVGGDRSAIANIGADNEQHFRLRYFTPGDGAAIHAERQLVRRPCRNHAKAPVVVDMPCSQRYPRELSEQV